MVDEADKLGIENAQLIREIDRLRIENTRLNSEIARLDRGQKSGNSQTDLNYVMKRANCLLWHASIAVSDDAAYLEWNVRPVRPDWAQSFFPLDLNKDESYWEAFYSARLEEDLEPAGQRNAAAIRAGLDYESEYRAIDFAGKVRWIHESVRIETEVPFRAWRAVGFCTDITAHKEMQGKIERRDEILRVAADVAGVGLLVIDSQHRYRYANHNYGGDKGLANLDIVGKTVSEVFEPNYAAEFTENVDRVLKGERVRHHQILKSTTEREAEQHFDVIIEPAADQSGPLAVVVLVDVTERDKIQEETRRLNVEAEKRATILGAARQVALDILRSRYGAEVMRHIADAARKLSGAEFAAIAIDDAHELDLPQIIAGGHAVAEGSLISSQLLTDQFLDSIKKHQNEPWSSSYSHDGSSVDADAYLHQPAVHVAVLGIPIVRDGKAIGTLFICGAPDGRKFDDAARAAVVTLADYAAVAIHFQQRLKQQRVLTHSFVNLLEEERRSVAYELHDGVTQHIMAASAFLDSYCSNKDTPVDVDLEKGLRCLRLAVHESRRLINGLRALTLDEMGLGRSIHQLLGEQAELAGWGDISFEHNTLDRRYGVELETAVYRIVQEALSNARKHASTDRLSIQLSETRSDHGTQLLTITVQDWGNGFDPGGVTTMYGHVGLQSMLERTRLMMGEFRIESTPGAGTTVSAVFDLSP